ncbi:MAG: tetratricopeptide repeat protein, partial [Tepidisphaeraceae bacterium]
CADILDHQPNVSAAWHLRAMIAARAGRNDIALDMIQRAIAIDPNAAELHANCGEFNRRLGKTDQAIASLRRAVELNPRMPIAWNNLGNALKDRGTIDEALAAYKQATDLQPDFATAHNNLGIALRLAGKLDESISAFDRAIELDPNDAGAHSNRGNALRDQGRFDEALAQYRRAIELNPDFAPSYANMGNVLSDQSRFAEAIAAYQKALQLQPDYAEALNNLGNAQRELGRFAEAMTSCREALRLKGGYPEAYDNLGNILFDQDRFPEALDAFRKGIELNPSRAIAHYNLALALGALGQMDEAIRAAERAVQLDGRYAEGFNALGNLLAEQGRYAEAADALERAIQLKPGLADAHVNLSFILLLHGHFEKGWAEHEWREKAKPKYSPSQFVQPKWDGGELKGRTILLHSEQGLGDTIQFARYAPLVAERGGPVVISCPEELRQLLQGLPGVARVTAEIDPGNFDCHCPLMSLPAVFATRVETIPAPARYLQAPAHLAASWRGRIGSEVGIRVGLAWAGNPKHKRDRRRSIRLEQLAPLWTVKGVRFYSLQRGDAAKQAAIPPDAMQLIDFSAELQNLADAAALVENLDLVISVDTATAHLSAALGKPTWVLLPLVPDWRWMLYRGDSPWYPTMRLFRQTAPDDWNGPIAQITQALRELVDRSAGAKTPPVFPSA